MISRLFFVLICGSCFVSDLSGDVRSKAQKGDPKSMFQLGDEYFYGSRQTKRNLTLAAYWYHRAAASGVVEAMFNYGVCLDGGFGVKQDREEAFKWYKKASEAGSRHAKFNMVQILFSGVPADKEKKTEGIKASPSLALFHLRELAAEQFEPAEILLAELYLEQRNDPALIRQAAEILLRLAKKDKPDPKVLRMLADCKYAGLGMKADSAEMIRLLKKAVELGDGEAAGKLAFCYEYGRGIPIDEKRAFELYKLGAERGNGMSQFKYAEYLILGRPEGNKADLAEALKWYKAAAESKNPQALFRMGVFYLDGMASIPKDPEKAVQYFYESARLGYAQAQYNLAILFSEGKGVMKDEAAALFWYLQAAKNGDAAAARTIGLHYLEGKGVSRSITKAEQWLRKAAQGGDMEAIRILQTRFR